MSSSKSKKSAFPEDMMKILQPEYIAKLFDPQQLMAQFSELGQPPVDLKAYIDQSREHYEGMIAANQAAAEAYKDLMAKQLEIFGKLTQSAKEHLEAMSDVPPSEATEKQTEIYTAAIDNALKLMAELSVASRNANEEAFQEIMSHVESAIADIKKL